VKYDSIWPDYTDTHISIGTTWMIQIIPYSMFIPLYDPNHPLPGGFKYVFFSPLVGEMIQFDEHIFQMGWFNHQLDYYPNIIIPGMANSIIQTKTSPNLDSQLPRRG